MPRASQRARPRAGTRRPDDERPADIRPYFSIPYWSAPRFPCDAPDDGTLRPLTAGVISWDCHGIHTGPYTPGETLDVSVDVRNAGGGNAAAVATVVVWWADPTVGFAKPTFFAAASVAVPPRGGLATTATMSAPIPAGAPAHICLLARVTNTLDQAGPVCDPVGDRHWAQRNLQAVAVAAGAPIVIPFLAANPFARETLFRLEVGVLNRDSLALLALRQRARPAEARLRVAVLDARGERAADGDRDGRLDVALGPRAGRLFHLAIAIDRDLDPDELAAVEIGLTPRDAEAPVGSLGIVVRGSDRDL
jgi:hypothetical protein